MMGTIFFSMVMKVHSTSKHDMDCFIKECARLFHDRWSRNHSSLSFCIQFFKQCVNITFQCALAFAIESKITLAHDVCFRLPLLLDHNLHAGDIKRVVSEIISYHKMD
jgi:hypothetical protein